ncbi:DotU family type IV/VI secretion system protein [Achromobacter sp.]|uniref:DotU family type IV/VI secretion system protein n=1 Tax=Achromobacter sp. TaxID=134375 RepID=UPI0028AA8785|nr:DotU family type IV/VI secretion system protein [Achromobacter sp.]
MTAASPSGDQPDLYSYTPMLDETLLHLSVLHQNAAIGPLHAWRARCVALMANVDEDLLARAVTPAQVRQLRLSHALLLDEATMDFCPDSVRKAWASSSLCEVELGQVDAGQAVLADIDTVCQQSVGAEGWLHWYALLFAAGLLRRSPDAARCRHQLSERLIKIWPSASQEVNGRE